VRALSVANEPLSISCEARLFDQGVPGQLGAVTPVEYLLISVAACFALSCRMALAQRQLVAARFEVAVRGTKALDLPSRLRSIDIELELPHSLAEHADAIGQRAKTLCTVTNTLAQALQPQLHVRSG
jgi:uncharacterized OsmC-like protein